MRIRFLAEIQVKEVPPGSGKRTIDFEYEYAMSKDLFKDNLDDIINNIRTIMNKLEFREKDINGIKRNRKKGYIYRDLLKQYCIYGTHPLLIKKEFSKFFDLNLTSGQEYDLEIRLSRVCNFDYVPKCLAIKNQSVNQISFDYKKKIQGTKYLFKKYLGEFLRFGIRFYILTG